MTRSRKTKGRRGKLSGGTPVATASDPAQPDQLAGQLIDLSITTASSTTAEEAALSSASMRAPAELWEKIIKTMLSKEEEAAAANERFLKRLFVMGEPPSARRVSTGMEGQQSLYRLSRTCKTLQDLCEPFFAVELELVLERSGEITRLTKSSVFKVLSSCPVSRLRSLAFLDPAGGVEDQLDAHVPKDVVKMLRGCTNATALHLASTVSGKLPVMIDCLSTPVRHLRELSFELDAEVTSPGLVAVLAKCTELRSLSFFNTQEFDFYKDQEEWYMPGEAQQFFTAMVFAIQDLPKLQYLELHRFGLLEGGKRRKAVWKTPLSSITLTEMPLWGEAIAHFLSQFAETLESAQVQFEFDHMERYESPTFQIPSFPRLRHLSIGTFYISPWHGAGNDENGESGFSWDGSLAQRLLEQAPRLQFFAWNSIQVGDAKELAQVEQLLREISVPVVDLGFSLLGAHDEDAARLVEIASKQAESRGVRYRLLEMGGPHQPPPGFSSLTWE